MCSSRYSEEQIIGISREVDAGRTVSEVVRKHGISEQAYCRWKANGRRLRTLNIVDGYNRVSTLAGDVFRTPTCFSFPPLPAILSTAIFTLSKDSRSHRGRLPLSPIQTACARLLTSSKCQRRSSHPFVSDDLMGNRSNQVHCGFPASMIYIYIVDDGGGVHRQPPISPGQ